MVMVMYVPGQPYMATYNNLCICISHQQLYIALLFISCEELLIYCGIWITCVTGDSNNTFPKGNSPKYNSDEPKTWNILVFV